MNLSGGGRLGAVGAWIDFLSSLGVGDPLRQGALVARNFVLDEGVLPERERSYAEEGCIADHDTLEDWKVRHERYLERKIALPADDEGPPKKLDPKVPEEIPETFRQIDPKSPFLGTDPQQVLVRVEELRFIAEKLGEDSDRLKGLFEKNLPWKKGKPESQRDLDAVLAEWHRRLDQRPVYSGFWEDLRDLFPGKDAKRDRPGWADRLRDRMGLAHHDPGMRSREIEFVVFRFPVKDVPGILGTGGRKRPLVTPTVLDGSFSEAFCPSPRGSTTGHVVNLDPRAGQLRREVLHPRLMFRHRHLWRLGRLTRPVEPAKLPRSRRVHLLLVRDDCGRDDYAAGTDGDLL